jgi:hypothetical protein
LSDETPNEMQKVTLNADLYEKEIINVNERIKNIEGVFNDYSFKEWNAVRKTAKGMNFQFTFKELKEELKKLKEMKSILLEKLNEASPRGKINCYN